MPKTIVAIAHTTPTKMTSSCVTRRSGRRRRVGLVRSARDRRPPAGTGHRHAGDRRLGRRPHPDGGDDPQVVHERDRRADHDHRAEPAVVVVHGRPDQIQLAEEADRRREAGEAEHRDRDRPREPRPRRPQPVQRGDVVTQRRLPLPRHDHREGGEVHDRVAEQVEDRRLHAEARRHHHAGQHVARLRDRRVRDQSLQRRLPDRARVADDDGDRGQGRQRRSPGRRRVDQRDVEEPQHHAERGGLGGHRHEGRDGCRRALVDVRRPLVERRHRRLEGQPGHHQRDAGEEEHVVAHLGARGGDPREVGRARRPVQEREPVQQGGRADRADDQVLEARLERVLAPHVRRAQHVERDREQLEAQEQRHEVLGRRPARPCRAPS